jgi:hypothetical protein
MSLAVLMADVESMTFYRLFFMKLLSIFLFQPVGTKTPNGIMEQSLCHITIAGDSDKHNVLLKRMLGGILKMSEF